MLIATQSSGGQAGKGTHLLAVPEEDWVPGSPSASHITQKPSILCTASEVLHMRLVTELKDDEKGDI